MLMEGWVISRGGLNLVKVVFFVIDRSSVKWLMVGRGFEVFEGFGVVLFDGGFG